MDTSSYILFSYLLKSALQEVQGCLGFQDIVGLDGAGLDGSWQCGLDVGGRGSDEELVFTLGNYPCRGGFVERGKVSSLHAELHSLTLTGLQVFVWAKAFNSLTGLLAALESGAAT